MNKINRNTKRKIKLVKTSVVAIVVIMLLVTISTVFLRFQQDGPLRFVAHGAGIPPDDDNNENNEPENPEDNQPPTSGHSSNGGGSGGGSGSSTQGELGEEYDVTIDKTVSLFEPTCDSVQGMWGFVDELVLPRHNVFVTFKIVVQNNGDNIIDVIVIDNLPDGITFASNADPATRYPIINKATQDIEWEILDLAPGKMQEIYFRARIRQTGTHENSATVFIEENSVLTELGSDTATIIIEHNNDPEYSLK